MLLLSILGVYQQQQQQQQQHNLFINKNLRHAVKRRFINSNSAFFCYKSVEGKQIELY
jgi:hypothetical protein